MSNSHSHFADAYIRSTVLSAAREISSSAEGMVVSNTFVVPRQEGKNLRRILFEVRSSRKVRYVDSFWTRNMLDQERILILKTNLRK